MILYFYIYMIQLHRIGYPDVAAPSMLNRYSFNNERKPIFAGLQ